MTGFRHATHRRGRARAAGPHADHQRRVEDLRDDRLAHRLRRRPAALIKAMVNMQGQATAGVSTVGQAAAAAALDGPQDGVAEMVARLPAPARHRGRDAATPAAASPATSRKARSTCSPTSPAASARPRRAAGGSTPTRISRWRCWRRRMSPSVHGASYGMSPYVRISTRTDDAGAGRGLPAHPGVLREPRVNDAERPGRAGRGRRRLHRPDRRLLGGVSRLRHGCRWRGAGAAGAGNLHARKERRAVDGGGGRASRRHGRDLSGGAGGVGDLRACTSIAPIAEPVWRTICSPRRKPTPSPPARRPWCCGPTRGSSARTGSTSVAATSAAGRPDRWATFRTRSSSATPSRSYGRSCTPAPRQADRIWNFKSSCPGLTHGCPVCPSGLHRTFHRHARTCSGHPRLYWRPGRRGWPEQVRP